MIELETKSYSSVENNRNRALEGLGIYLQTPEEKILREYQEDTIESYYNFLLKGQTAGYIILPGGAGKTIFAVELARATGLKTVFLSPSQPILEQTHLRFQQFAPNIQVSNYYTHEKQTSGQVLNTTYQSFINLLE
ncbi:MAG: RNA polymerase sigma factor, partial [Microgenomates group bacterium Gr01-1014_93]